VPRQNDITYSPGFSETLRTDAAVIYDQAFGAKISLAIPDRDKRIALLAEWLLPNFAFAALMNDELVGLAGFHTPDGSLTGGVTGRSLLSKLGWIRGLWAVYLLSLYQRTPDDGQLVMDGIAVRGDMRGRGIGGQLLDQLTCYARENGYTRIRLDVIDTNPAARRLYERKGFQSVHTERFPFLKWYLGFGAATQMELAVTPASSHMAKQ
jgi:ribosomal protein S18 acetylase RimI-like enzyme